MATVPTDYKIGDKEIVGFAVNGDNGGSTEGGTPGDYVYLRPRTGTVNFRPGDADQIDIDTMDIDDTEQDSGLKVYSGSMSFMSSYSSQEKLAQLISGGSISTTGTGPYDHAVARGDQLLFGSLKIWINSNLGTGGGEIWTFTDVVIKDIEESMEQGGKVTTSLNWVAKGGSSAAGVAPSVTAVELIRWKRTALTIAGNTWVPKTISFKIEQALKEDDAGLDTTLSGGLASISRAGKRKASITVDIGTDSVLAGYAAAPDTAIGSTANNSLVHNNGLLTTSEREREIILGKLYPQPVDRSTANHGKEMNSRTYLIKDDAPFAYTFKNALTTITA